MHIPCEYLVRKHGSEEPHEWARGTLIAVHVDGTATVVEPSGALACRPAGEISIDRNWIFYPHQR